MDRPPEPAAETPGGDNVDPALRLRHLGMLSRAESRDMYERTLAQCLERPCPIAATDQDMIFDLCQAEEIKLELAEDIKRRGVVVETRNGRQVFRKENPSLARMSRYTELQRKIRADLGITPGKRMKQEEEAEAPEEGADAFEAF